MSDEPNALAALEARLATVQEQIRDATQRRAELMQAGNGAALAAFDADLAALRQQRQALLDEQLRLQRARLAEPATPDARGLVADGAGRRAVSRAQGRPPLALRLAVTLLVFGGVAAVVVGGLFYMVERFLVPPPIEGVAMGEQGEFDTDFALRPGQSPEEIALAVYLAANRESILRAPSDDPAPITFQIEPGENAATIAARLAEEGLIEDETLFRRLLQYRGADQALEAGTFELSRNMLMDEIIVELQQGELEAVTFTFPEGWRAEQMAALLEEQGLTTAVEYMALVRDPSRFDYDFLRDLPPGSTLEGFLFPDTYSVFKDEATAESIIRGQLDVFGQRITPELRAAAQARGISLYEVLILASIVEREAVVAEERPTIAGVYLNRLTDGTVLNADPTIQYALGFQAETGQWWKRPLTSEDLQLDSPYNTYLVPGLPPSPISNPGLASIRATIEAPATEFYYFVSRNDGTHVFATTLDEHLQNVAEFQSGN